MSPMPPPQMPPKAEPKDMPGMLQAVKDETTMLERTMAGYTHLTTIVAQLQGAGGRKIGLPIFEYRGSTDGVHPMVVSCDLAKIEPQYQLHVLSPMCNVHAQEMLEALQRIHNASGRMLAQVQVALGVAPPQTQQNYVVDDNKMDQAAYADPIDDIPEAIPGGPVSSNVPPIS